MSIINNDSYFSNLNAQSSSSLSSSKLSDALNLISNASEGKGDPEKIKEAFKQFEGMFISQLLKEMFKTVKASEEFHGGVGEDTFREFLTEEYGNVISKAGGMGIADSLQRTLLQLQEVEKN